MFQIGLAKELELEVPLGRHQLLVTLPDRSIEITRDVDVAGEQWFGVSLINDERLEVEISTEPFRYA